MLNLSAFARVAALAMFVAATIGSAAGEKAPAPVKPPKLAGTTWSIQPTGNGNLTAKTVAYANGGVATIWNAGTPKPPRANATWTLDLKQNYVFMFAEGGMRAYRSTWAMNGQPQNPMLGFSCTLKAPSRAPKFNCADNGSNYVQAPQ